MNTPKTLIEKQKPTNVPLSENRGDRPTAPAEFVGQQIKSKTSRGSSVLPTNRHAMPLATTIGGRLISAIIVCLFVISVATSTSMGGELQQPSNAAADQENERLAVPSKSEYRSSLKNIQTIFADQYANRAPDGKTILAAELLKLGKTTTDDVRVRYTCLLEAIEIAQQANQVATAMNAADELVKRFEVNELELRLEIVNTMSRNLRDSAALTKLIDRCRPMIQTMIDANDFKTANSSARKLLAAAKRGASDSTVASLDNLLRQLKVIDRKFKAIQTHLTTLESNAADPAANQAVGEFYALAKGDFVTGLPFLTKGADQALAEIAKLETGSDTPDSKLKVADYWWAFAEANDDRHTSEAARAHAAELYRLVVEDTQGITKARVEKRLESLVPDGAQLQQLYTLTWQVDWEKGYSDWEQLKINEDGNVVVTVFKKEYSNMFEVTSETQVQWVNKIGERFIVDIRGAQLLCQKFDKAGKLLHTGVGTPLSR